MSLAAPLSPPPLRDGDRLTSDEFMRRWEAMPGLKQAELLDGIVYMPSPVSRRHSDFHVPLSWWLNHYAVFTPGCRAGLEGTWIMGDGDVPSPDLALRILPEHGGQSRDEGEYTAGAPELVLEVAVSSRARDLGVKFKLYERMRVREYLVAVVSQATFLWHEWTESGFRLIEPDSEGILRSRHFPGLWLDAAALWRLDQPQILTVLQQGLATPEHAAFVTRLAAKRG
ncbi:MAG TPA: Uma2 family endonuclease [Bryobacteraceae bacterium]|nr:Uma2 family endonuclease [Bryobacteraceae bacterium]